MTDPTDTADGGIPSEFIRRDPYAVLTDARPHKVVDWPGRPGVAVALWNLSEQETRDARVAVLDYLKRPRPEGLGLPEEYLIHDALLVNDETDVQVLVRALRDPNDPQRPFFHDDKETGKPSPRKLRLAITPDERTALFRLYLAYVEERSPISRAETVAAIEEVVDSLGKGSLSASYLHSYDAASLVRIASALVDRLRTPTSANSSSGGSPSVSDGP